MARFHPNAEFLAEYSSGSLTPAQAVSVSAHLHFCTSCRDHVHSLEEIGGLLLERANAEALSGGALERVMACIESGAPTVEAGEKPGPAMDTPGCEELPALVRRLVPEAGMKWQSLSPSLQIARLPIGERRFELALHRIKAGGKAPEHDHRGLEITVVLKGSFSDEDAVYQEGDFIVREPGQVHTPNATRQDECICLSACEAPIRMVGPLKRLLNPFLGFKPA